MRRRALTPRRIQVFLPGTSTPWRELPARGIHLIARLWRRSLHLPASENVSLAGHEIKIDKPLSEPMINSEAGYDEVNKKINNPDAVPNQGSLMGKAGMPDMDRP